MHGSTDLGDTSRLLLLLTLLALSGCSRYITIDAVVLDQDGLPYEDCSCGASELT
jgi:hypothetical protein